MPVDKPPPAYNFTNLTLAQQELLTFQGWATTDAPHRSQPSAATVRKLIRRGLLTTHRTSSGVLTVVEYTVPIPVHMAWCEWCSVHTDEGDGNL